MTKAAFHSAMPTDIADEISLAENLIACGRLLHGRDAFARRMRTDPMVFFRRCHYDRWHDRESRHEYIIAEGFRGESKATLDAILTPSHKQWPEFSERLLSLLVTDDFSWRYAPAGGEYWPLASAEIVRSMGFAVAETLTVFGAFFGTRDRDIYDHVENLWNKTPPRKGEIPFDCRG